MLKEIPHLHQLLIVSEVNVVEELSDAKTYQHVSVAIEKHQGDTCERCWVSSHDVGDNPAHPSLCVRCADVVEKHYKDVE